MNIDVDAIITLIAGLLGGGGLVAWYKARSENRLSDAEAWAKLVQQLQLRIETLDKRVCDLEKAVTDKDNLIDDQAHKIEEQGREIDRLSKQVEALQTENAVLKERVVKLAAELAQYRTGNGST